MYEYGLGVPQDYVEAVKWYQLAADRGYAKAQYNLGIMYANGRAVAQDFVTAHLWLDLAARGLPALDAKNLDDAIATRDDIANRMTEEQLNEAQRRTREWLAAHASPK